MAVTSVVSYADARELAFPVSGAGANIPVGAIMYPGATGGTNYGVAIPITAGGELGAIGVLNEPHNFAASGDATTATVVQWFEIPAFNSNNYLQGNKTSGGGPFPSHKFDLFDTAVLMKISYNLASTMAVASATSTVVTITSETANKDSGFLYVNAGTGIGQLSFIKSSASGSDTIVAQTSGVTLDNTSKLTQILPLFWQYQTWKVNTTTVGTLVDSAAGTGTARATVIANFISLNGLSSRLDPKIHGTLTGLNLVSQLDFYSYMAMIDTSFHPIQ